MTQATSAAPLPSPAFTAHAIGVTLPGPPDRAPFTQIATDSRQVRAGGLFVAIAGEKFDGHDFLEAALRAGARGVLCRKDRAPQPTADLRVFAVDDPLAAYRKLARAWRREFTIPVVAVAGSVGKTTTKELLSALLEGRWPGAVLRTSGSQNGFVGIPMTLLELRPEHRAAVIEVGIDEVGAMAQHLPVVAPTVSLLTAIGPEHLEKLIDVPTVAREEGLALTYTAQQGGTVIVNLDDEWIRPFMSTLRAGRRLGFTLEGRAGESVLEGALDADGRSLAVRSPGDVEFRLPLPLPGRHNAANLLCAVATAHALGLSPEEMARGLAGFRGADGRSQVRRLKDGTRVLCDYYNANPSSVAAAIDVLAGLAREGGPVPRWACLADMLELGPDEERFHRELAEPLVRAGVEHVLLYGPRMRALREELERRGFAGHCAWFESHAAMAEAVIREARPGDAVLFKGSRSMRMEEVYRPFAAARGEA